MEQSPFWEANSHSASQEGHRILWNLKFHFHVLKAPQPSPPPIHSSLPSVRRIQSTISHTMVLRSILILCSHPRLIIPSGVSHSCFLTKILYSFLISPVRSTCPANLIFLDLITLEAYKLWSSSLCNLTIHPPPPSLLVSNIRLSTLLSISVCP
jgi:hypothetical protein